LQKVSFDPLRDFAPIAPIGEFSHLLVAHPAVPAKTVRELIALAKARKGNLSYGSNGVGSAYHLAGVLFCAMADIDMLHVPYRGGGSTAISDLVTGRVDLMWNSPVFLLPHVSLSRLRAIGVTGPARIAALPDVPTIAEGGLRGYELVGWQGILAPAATPNEIISRLNSAMQTILSAPDVKEQWTAQGMEAVARTPDQFAARLRADYESYGKLISRIAGKLD
jgi:tripartite-type tricarboxylate transporter receptor subunit TctC